MEGAQVLKRPSYHPVDVSWFQVLALYIVIIKIISEMQTLYSTASPFEEHPSDRKNDDDGGHH